MQKIVPYLIILFVFAVTASPYKKVIHHKTDYSKLKNLYENSQYAPDPLNRREIIQDGDLYSYSGMAYLREGRLDEINYEHPPLGKYLFGISYYLFGNTLIPQIFLGITLLFLVYGLSLRYLRNSWLAILPPVLLAQEKLFLEQITFTLLDLFQVVAISTFLLAAMAKKQTKWQLIILGVSLGVVAGVKFPTVAILLGVSYLIGLFLKKDPQILKRFAVVISVSILVYLSSYLPIAISKGPQAIVITHIKALKFHVSHVPEYPPLAPVKVMFLNQWPVWFDKINPVHKVAERNIFWPILAFSVLTAPIIFFLLQKDHQDNILVIFSFLYFAFINTRLFFPRYLILVLPYMYILCFWGALVIFQKVKKALHS
jgi:predicted membrane-bound dolichyl-phosphate-mannose-protein mannosyltransferase